MNMAFIIPHDINIDQGDMLLSIRTQLDLDGISLLGGGGVGRKRVVVVVVVLDTRIG